MKDGNKVANICVIVLLLVSTVETVVTIIFGLCSWYNAIVIDFLFVVGACLVRFHYQIAHFRNIMHSFYYRASSDDDEPSLYAIQIVRFIGYVLMFVAVVAFLVFAINY